MRNLNNKKNRINQILILLGLLQKLKNGIAPNLSRNMLITFLVIVSISTTSVAIYFWKHSNLKTNDLNNGTGRSSANDMDEMIAKISTFMVLPQDEKPTFATVSDPEKLKDQPFFTKAKAGDKVLIYTKAKRAILYDPVANKIVEVAPINLGDKSGM